jgi:hypothetical protein
MTNLSPAAQAVASAYDNTPEKDTDNHRYLWLAAALRSAADQVISPVSPPCEDFNEYDQGFLAAHIKYRAELLAIADELENS